MAHLPLDKQITFIYGSDLQVSARFYENVLGLRLWKDQGSCRIYETVGGALLGICQSDAASKGRVSGESQDNLILTFVTDEVDGWYTLLQSNGVQFERPPETNIEYNIYHCFLRDPDGYLIEIQRFLD